MSNEIVFVIGLSIGGIMGVFALSLFVSRRIVDLQSEIRDLRIQRKLLKEELQKPQGKPTPRKKRYRTQPKRK
tara:strand:+ start:1310 stop:1528 length:219 start_codon:yes stop_codon:yes gene_type:complete